MAGTVTAVHIYDRYSDAVVLFSCDNIFNIKMLTFNMAASHLTIMNWNQKLWIQHVKKPFVHIY